MVHGRARAISVDTGVGKAESDGPKSARQDAPPEGRVLLERRAAQAVELAQRRAHLLDRLGAVLPKEVATEIDCSTGSIGVACVMT